LYLVGAVALRAGDAVLGRVGLERADRRATTCAALERLRNAGVAPATVIDAGAAYGRWSLGCAEIFPDARYVLVDPLDEFAPFLEDTASRLPGAITVHAALADAPGRRVLNVHADLVGSSLRDEADDTLYTTPREVLVTSIDNLVTQHALDAPFLLKLDVQGTELDVLRGATEALTKSCAVVVEVAVLPFFREGGGFAELTQFLASAGFELHDLADLAYRPRDGALAQVDALFVEGGSVARADRVYADPRQRAAQDRRFQLAYQYRRNRLRRRAP
jgi:FkbM family methyltransferase